jgi:hypothetical protein
MCSAANYAQAFSYRHIRRAARRQVGKMRTAPTPLRIVAPRAISRKPQEQVVQQNL